MDVFGAQEEIAGQDVPAEQIHHLGLPVGCRAAGGATFRVEDDDAGRAEVEPRRPVEGRILADES